MRNRLKVSDVAILMQPGFQWSAADHWMSRWQSRVSTARLIKQDWSRANRGAWVANILSAVSAAEGPVILVAHSLGVIAAVHAAPALDDKVKGAFLVAPSDWDRPDLLPGVAHDMSPIPLLPLPFPSMVVASRNDPYCAVQRASDFAEAWGSAFIDAGEAGHINTQSGHGPWPEGLMTFAGFLSKLA